MTKLEYELIFCLLLPYYQQKNARWRNLNPSLLTLSACFYDCAHSQSVESQRVRLDWATNTQSYKMPEKCLVELTQNWEWTTKFTGEKFMDPLNKVHLGLNLNAAIQEIYDLGKLFNLWELPKCH